MVGLCLLTTPVGAEPRERGMSVVYERSGGIAGTQQRLELDTGKRTLRFNDRRLGGGERALSEEELTRLKTLLETARGEQPPTGGAGYATDSFTLRLSVDGQLLAELGTFAVPLGKGDGSPWGELLSFVDKLLEQALQTKRPPGAPQILSAEDLEKS